MRVSSEPQYYRLQEDPEFLESPQSQKSLAEPVDIGPTSNQNDRLRDSSKLPDFDVKNLNFNSFDGARLGSRIGLALTIVGIPLVMLEGENIRRKKSGAAPIKIPKPISVPYRVICAPAIIAGELAGAMVGGIIGGIGEGVKKIANRLEQRVNRG